MGVNKYHWKSDGTCNCPLIGKCFECGKSVTDHDLVADCYWCNACIDRHLDEDEANLLEGKGR
jgi:hypothetical protein